MHQGKRDLDGWEERELRQGKMTLFSDRMAAVSSGLMVIISRKTSVL